jgi:hypothetical protein
MKSITLIALTCCLCLFANAQPSKEEQQKLKRVLLMQLTKIRNERKADSIIKATYSIAATGKGSGTFSNNILILQTYFTTKRKIHQFEKSLNSWQRTFDEGADISPEIKYAAQGTIDDESLIYRVIYDNTDKSGQDLNIIVEFGVDSIIKAITFRMVEDNINVDKAGNYISKLKNAGYVFDIASTRIAEKYGHNNVTYAKNPANKVKVRMLENENGTLITVVKGW